MNYLLFAQQQELLELPVQNGCNALQWFFRSHHLQALCPVAVAAAHQSGQCAARGRGVQKLGVAALCLDAVGDLRLAIAHWTRGSWCQAIQGFPREESLLVPYRPWNYSTFSRFITMLNGSVNKPGLQLVWIEVEGGELPVSLHKNGGSQIRHPFDETGKTGATDNNSDVN